MDITWIETIYDAHTGLCNSLMLVLVFGGMARLAFWRDADGLRVGGPLAAGLAMLLTVAMLKWMGREGRSLVEFGPMAAFLICEAILLLGWRAFTKSSKL